jgi:hypothetical protein
VGGWHELAKPQTRFLTKEGTESCEGEANCVIRVVGVEVYPDPSQ